jgi:hypothetical protein
VVGPSHSRARAEYSLPRSREQLVEVIMLLKQKNWGCDLGGFAHTNEHREVSSDVAVFGRR